MPQKRLTKRQLKERGRYYTVKVLEEFRFWMFKHQWNPDDFRKIGFNLMSISAKAGRTIQKGKSTKYTKRDFLKLPCGLSIDKGASMVNPQKNSVTVTNVRVDGIVEANQVLKDLSNMFEIYTWEITQLTVHNRLRGPILKFSVFNPDSTGNALYLDAAEDSNGVRYYYDIPPMEQQSLCNGIQEQIACCAYVKRLVPTCGLKKHYEEKNK